MDKILILQEQEQTDAVIAFLTEGRGAPAMLLIISYATPEAAHSGMELMGRCQSWEIACQDCTLYVIGRGLGRLQSGEIAQVFHLSEWQMEDDYVVSLFVRHSELQGFFLVQPAVNKIILPLAVPVPCFLE